MNLTGVILEDGKVIHSMEEIGLTVFDMPYGSYPVLKKSLLDLTVVNTGKQVLQISGSASFEVGIPCDRCLQEVTTPIRIDFVREADMKLSEQERADALDESNFLHGYNLDVDELVYGEALLIWPMKVLCRPDCKGLCRICGQNLNLKTCDCDSTDLDPRMAKIRGIFSNFKEV